MTQMNASIPFAKPGLTSQPASGSSALAIKTGKRVLIVDDSVVILKALSVKLRAKGYEVYTAVDGSEAVSTVRRERPDLILLDINFPPDVAHGGGVAWDGFLILNWVRRLEEAKNVPVIFISGADPKKYEQRAVSQGDKFFRKPLDGDQLLAAVREVLSPVKSNVSEKKRILFIDDEQDWRHVVGNCLEEAGFQVVTAKYATEALRRMETL